MFYLIVSVNDADALRGGPAVALDGHVDEVVHQQVGLVGKGSAVVALGQVFVKRDLDQGKDFFLGLLVFIPIDNHHPLLLPHQLFVEVLGRQVGTSSQLVSRMPQVILECFQFNIRHTCMHIKRPRCCPCRLTKAYITAWEFDVLFKSWSFAGQEYNILVLEAKISIFLEKRAS